MPFASLSELPANVRKLSNNKQRRWRAIWNSVFSQTKDEAKAFKSANAIIKESTNMRKNGMRDIEHSLDITEAIGNATVNMEKGVIENVLILTGGKVSRNKTLYTPKAMSEAVNRYDGAKMYLDHPNKDDGPVRSVRDFGGTYRNVRLEEGKLLKADLHLLPNQQIRDIVLPIAEAKPAGVGLSIRDRGRGREEDGVFLVEGFAKGRGFSIDLVTEASVNENLFESEGGDDMKIEDIKLEELQEGNPTLVEQIKSTERASVLKEVEEKLKKGEDATQMLAQGRKLVALAEAGLPSEVAVKVKTMIEPESVTVEVAEGIIKAQKEICESLTPKGGKPAGKEPQVTNHGGSKAKDEGLEEGALPSDDEIVRSLAE